MSTYEVEHNTTDPSAPTTSNNNTTTTTTAAPHRRRRPDLSTFFSTLSEISPEDAHARTRPHAVPVPRDVSAAFYSLAEALDVMRRGSSDPIPPTGYGEGLGLGSGGGSGNEGEDLLAQMISSLLRTAEMPPREVEGVSEEFCDVLDRVPRSTLKPDQICPICNNPFLEDQYPLVVQLPCHPTHLFDLECVRPWLRLRGTCPLDRTDFAKQEREKAEARRKPVVDDDEEWDGMYG
ncbi:uncharacterized protein BO80DRAFT_389146 [Aspergillus ibericus CBS 121593]|uniref:RING-type domain-containing protein n=1 Tax=Aspergillus ibericus CBS 121593 TaxID=1448316 RepID=A0A395GQK2_9EURO|nr:hypothetical protein BO80DRAFT_389146 [Aspergillus ibericus CBS 121593]RAK97759.1 hypothetical protein BO80DRAFT_389146 [Aspergillus ibericus CBS 121593]